MPKKLAYSCENISPNASNNGVWLRGGTLAKQGEGDPPRTTDTGGYTKLGPKGKATAYHPAIHTTYYMNNVAGRLRGYVGTNFNCDEDGVDDEMAGMRTELANNDFGFGGLPGQDAPPGQD